MPWREPLERPLPLTRAGLTLASTSTTTRSNTFLWLGGRVSSMRTSGTRNLACRWWLEGGGAGGGVDVGTDCVGGRVGERWVVGWVNSIACMSRVGVEQRRG